MWDTAGQERFQTITASYYKGALGVFLVYDSTQRSTFRAVENWLLKIEKHADENILKVLVANKSDVLEQEVPTLEGPELAEKHGMTFFATSARTGSNVVEMFSETASLIIKQ